VTFEPSDMAVETVPASVARIRRFAVEACRAGRNGADCDTVALLVSELATNALVHGSGELRVRVRVLVSDADIRVEVSDGSPVQPVRHAADALEENGRGIALVEELSSAWGTEGSGAGKKVWFEVPAG
jgi:anti-sigma regulatory factor (Ser/Thr protein kinase)